MRKEELMGVVVRLFAVAMAIYVVTRLPAMAGYLGQTQGPVAYQVVFLLIAALLLAVAALFWAFPVIVARGLLLQSRDEGPLLPWTSEEVLSVGFILIGIYLGFGVISDALYWLFSWFAWRANQLDFSSFPPEARASVYVTAIEFVIVLFLVFGSRGLAHLILSARSAGRPNA